jgi:hypothetical protein
MTSSRSCASCRRTASHPGRSSGSSARSAASSRSPFAAATSLRTRSAARARRAAASAALRPARPHPHGARATLRRLPAALSAAAAHGGVHGYAALRGAGAELGRHRLRPRLGLRSPPTCAWPPRRAAAPHLTEDPRLCARDPAPPPARRGSAGAQARLTRHCRIGLRVRDAHGTAFLHHKSPSACSAGLPAAPASIGRAGGCASTICATPSPAT